MSWPSGDPGRPSWRADVFQDAARIWDLERPTLRHLLGAFMKDSGLAAAFLFRWASRYSARGHPFLANLTGRVNLALHGCLIHPQARIEPGLRLPHPVGVVVGQGVRAGRDLTLFQHVTLGARSMGGNDYPEFGNGVIVFPNSLVLGSIRVGDNARVGAGSVVLHEVAPGDTVAGAPAASLRHCEDRPASPGGLEAR